MEEILEKAIDLMLSDEPTEGGAQWMNKMMKNLLSFAENEFDNNMVEELHASQKVVSVADIGALIKNLSTANNTG